MNEVYAFPTGDSARHESGMFLRDYFAARATEQDIEQHRGFDRLDDADRPIYTESREVAKFKYADAMVKAREVKP